MRGTGIFHDPNDLALMLVVGVCLGLYWLMETNQGMYRLLAYGGGTGGVFTVVDHHVIVPATLLLSVVTMCAAIVVAWAGWTGQMRLAFGAVTTVGDYHDDSGA